MNDCFYCLFKYRIMIKGCILIARVLYYWCIVIGGANTDHQNLILII